MNYHNQIREDAKQANELLAILDADGEVDIDLSDGFGLWQTHKRNTLTIDDTISYRFTPKQNTRPMNYGEWKEYLGTCAFVIAGDLIVCLVQGMNPAHIKINDVAHTLGRAAELFTKLNGDPLTVTKEEGE